jgi:hypothetical protein
MTDKQTTRPLVMPRLEPGTRVRYHYAKWVARPHQSALHYDAEYATREWAQELIGTVITVEEHGPFPDHHPWGVPIFATPIRWDNNANYFEWVRTSCLDVIGWAAAEPVEGPQQLELFA